jgi:nicotinate-nucleotide pyrophosphorylase (carboxylating)
MLEKFIKSHLLTKDLKQLIKIALIEDNAYEDITSDLIIAEGHLVSFSIATRQDIICCGLDIITYTIEELKASKKFINADISFDILYQDGDFIKAGTDIAKGRGEARLIFAAERTMLNLLQHLSGIATMTDKFIKLSANSKIKILDTRKTLPNLRLLQKYAVKIGGGDNHRFALNEMILIKDNHIAAAGSIKNALSKVKAGNINKLLVEIECDNLGQVREVLEVDIANIIMLDNMNCKEIKQAVEIIDKRAKIEVSGGVNLSSITEISKIDIDFISIGALTHSVMAVDIGLDIKY